MGVHVIDSDLGIYYSNVDEYVSVSELVSRALPPQTCSVCIRRARPPLAHSPTRCEPKACKRVSTRPDTCACSRISCLFYSMQLLSLRIAPGMPPPPLGTDHLLGAKRCGSSPFGLTRS